MKTKRMRLAWWAAVALVALCWASPGARAQFSRGSSSPYGEGTYGGTSRAYDTSSAQFWGSGNSAMPLFVRQFMPSYSTNSAYGNSSGLNFFASGTQSSYMTGGASTCFNCAPAFNTSSYRSSYSEAPRKAIDRWSFDRDRLVSANEAQRKQEELVRYLSKPNQADVTSGAALNAILDGLELQLEKMKTLPPVPTEESFLKALNFTRGTGSIGLLRNQGKIEWPPLLLNLAPKESVAKVRQQIETQLQAAYSQVVESGNADPDNLKTLLRSIDALNDMSSNQAQSMTFAQNVEVKRYVKSLEDSVAFLKQPDAADWLPGKHKAKPKTVQELVQLMIDKKVRFAPAIVGNDAAYAKMHRALVVLYTQSAPTQVGANR